MNPPDPDLWAASTRFALERTRPPLIVRVWQGLKDSRITWLAMGVCLTLEFDHGMLRGFLHV